MKHPLFGQALVLCAALSLPALAAAPLSGTPAASKSARVIVKFKGDGPLMRESALSARAGELPRVQHASRLSQRHGVSMSDGYPVAPRTQVVFAQGLSSAELVAKLQTDPDVEVAEVDVRVKRAAAPNDPLYGPQSGNVTPAAGQWYLRDPAVDGQVSSINAEQAWDLTLGSPAIVVAVLDTGVRGDHPDLVGKLLRGYDFVSEDFANNFATANDGDGRDADPSDPGDWVTQAEVDGVFAGQGCVEELSSWHGTQTASLVAAATNDGAGMAGTGRNVRVMPVRVLGKCGGFTSDVIAAMYWAAGLAIPSGSDLGTAPTNTTPAKVLNLSLGSAQSCSMLYQAAVTAVTGAGASVVVSAGNGVGTAVGQPANCNGAIGVGGLRHVGTKVGFSDVGPQVAISAPGGNCVNLTGACLFPILGATNSGTTVPGTNTYSDGLDNPSFGTSFSAPMVSAVAALMLSRNPELTPAQVRTTMRSAARPFPVVPGVATCQPPSSTQQNECNCTSSTCGAGMLDAAAAVTAAGSPAQPRALIFTSPAIVLPNTTITVDGSTSVGGNGTGINQYLWSLPANGSIAALGTTTNASTATITTTGEGTFTVQLRVTDANNATDTRTMVVTVATPPVQQPSNPSNGSGGGGGALSWPWLLALLIAWVVLRPRRPV
jgi:serine protease